ncbi:MAG: hypothetical protein ABSG44_00825 [Thermodesulfobacteriota bacterium]
MLERATTILALATCFFGCATQVATQSPSAPQVSSPAPQPALLSRLTVSDISLNETGKIEVMLSNTGKGPAPYGVGSLAIYVDGLLKWKDSLGTLPDQRFLEPGGAVLYTTPVELVGRHDVRAVVDEGGKTVEEDKLSNVFPKVLGKERLETKPLLPGLRITDLFLDTQRKLSVTLTNLGDSPFPLRAGNLRISVDGLLAGSYPMEGLSNQPYLPPKGNLIFTTPLALVGRHEILARVEFASEVKKSDEEDNSLKRILDGPSVGPDIVVKDLDLTEDLELMIILSNAGETDLRKGAIFQIQVFVNDQRISEFDHFISEVMKANFGNRYIVAPPYRVEIAGISRIKVSISPELPSDDIRSENNSLKKTFVIFPFKIGPRRGEEFNFSISPPSTRGEAHGEKVRAEARCEGGSSALMLSFKLSGSLKGGLTFSGRSPLKVEFPVPVEELQKESVWSVLVTNPAGKKVEGHLIIEHP